MAECESVLRVEAAWFGAIAKLSPKLQWARSAIVVAHILSDRDKECSVVGGHCVAGAIAKSVVKKIRDRFGFEPRLGGMDASRFGEVLDGLEP